MNVKKNSLQEKLKNYEFTYVPSPIKKGKDDSNKELLEQVNAVIKEIQEKKEFEKQLDKYAQIAAQSE